MVNAADKTMVWRAHGPDGSELPLEAWNPALDGFPGASEYSRNGVGMADRLILDRPPGSATSPHTDQISVTHCQSTGEELIPRGCRETALHRAPPRAPEAQQAG